MYFMYCNVLQCNAIRSISGHPASEGAFQTCDLGSNHVSESVCLVQPLGFILEVESSLLLLISQKISFWRG